MNRKLQEYFKAGVELVWFIYPRTHTAEVYTAPDRMERIGESSSLSGGAVLPGFKLPLKKLFERAGRQAGPKNASPKDSGPQETSPKNGRTGRRKGKGQL